MEQFGELCVHIMCVCTCMHCLAACNLTIKIWLLGNCKYTHILIHTHTHTHMHTKTYTQTHTHRHTDTQTHTSHYYECTPLKIVSILVWSLPSFTIRIGYLIELWLLGNGAYTHNMHTHKYTHTNHNMHTPYPQSEIA